MLQTRTLATILRGINSGLLYENNVLNVCYQCMKRLRVQHHITARTYCTQDASSALYVNESLPNITPIVRVDLNLGKLLSNTDSMRQNLEDRKMECVDLDTLTKDWHELKRLRSERDKLKAEDTEIAEMLTAFEEIEVKSEDIIVSRDMLKKRQSDIQISLRGMKDQLWEVESKVMLAALKIPNKIHPLTPDDNPAILEQHIDPAEMSFHGLSHVDVARKHDLISFKHIGPRSYFLKGKLVKLKDAIIDHLSSILRYEDYLPISGPGIFRTPIVESFLADRFKDPSQAFSIDKQKSHSHDERMADFNHLMGTSPSVFAAYLMRKNIQEDHLPLKYYTTGTNYTPRDKDLPGLMGAFQSVQVHLCQVVRTDEAAFRAFCVVRDMLWVIYKDFNLPIRLVISPAAHLETYESLRAEVQLFFPYYKKFIKISSVSLVNDHISRRLPSLHSPDKKEIFFTDNYTHMVFAEVFCAKRLLAGLLEYTNPEDSDRFPEWSFLQR